MTDSISLARPSRRNLLLGSGAMAALSLAGLRLSMPKDSSAKPDWRARAIKEVDPYLTPQEDFWEVTRSRPYLMPKDKLAAAGLTRDTWKLEIDADPDAPAKLGNPMTRELGTAFDFAALMELAKTKAVRYSKALTCLNNNRILGSGIWEGVPLRDVLWMADPESRLRRVFYYGYYGDQPRAKFISSLPVGRVLEDAFGLPPVILCYKLNDQWLSGQRGGPVRVVVPEAYAFKSVKWVTNIVLTNSPFGNDSYARGNNDIDTHMKSFARFEGMPKKVAANEPFLIKGYAQAGVSGVEKVQVWSHNTADGDLPLHGRFVDAPWVDGELLPAPGHWGNAIADGKIPQPTRGFDPKTARPRKWPIDFTKLNWMFVHPGLPPGKHMIRCRTVDRLGHAQPMPRPFQKSGHAKIELRLVNAV